MKIVEHETYENLLSTQKTILAVTFIPKCKIYLECIKKDVHDFNKLDIQEKELPLKHNQYLF
jgi:hypothetical protein